MKANEIMVALEKAEERVKELEDISCFNIPDPDDTQNGSINIAQLSYNAGKTTVFIGSSHHCIELDCDSAYKLGQWLTAMFSMNNTTNGEKNA